MSLTAVQQKAVVAEGNVLLMAGAGTGKTRTLVERCLSCLLDRRPPSEISEILVVTFTEAAAAEMRGRLRQRLQECADAASSNGRAAQQLALFETAHIGTLHSFCLELVRRHFYLLELDPQFSVMSEEEARLLASEQLDALFADIYSAKTALAKSARELIGTHGDGSDQSIRALVHRLHNYAQTLPDPEGWKLEQIRLFSQNEPSLWKEWLHSGLLDFKRTWLSTLREMSATNGLAQQCLSILEGMPDCVSSQRTDGGHVSEHARTHEAQEEGVRTGHLKAASSILMSLRSVPDGCPKGKKGVWLEPLEGFFDEAQFLCSLLPKPDGTDPLVEDWSWVSSQMRTLLELSSEFTGRFSKAKRDLALADFHDLEQFALRLLWDNQSDAPSPIAQQWRKQFRHVLVDEYQDINAAQDQILKALSRDGKEGNRFLVGDLKQSIYRFRLAAPRIFQSYMRDWRKGPGTVIPLNENFRSREGALDFINSVFEMLMTEDLGGISYDADARLRFGAPEERQHLSTKPGDAGSGDGQPRVEFHIRVKARKNGENGQRTEADDSISDLEETAKEARLTALELRKLKDARHAVWDEELKKFRPVDWKDMAILLRSRSGKTEFYAREFSRLHIPLAAARGDFFESTEISDILSLLAILDNPLQDLPVLAVLRSPLVGLSMEELAEVRLAAEGPFWTALRKGRESQKIGRFLERYSRWRTYARQMSLSACLEEILVETRYPEWLLTQSRGPERFANLQGLVNLARKFDRFQRQGLLRFLLFIEAQKSADAEPPIPSVIDENAVRLMSIHQSKGLEFPVVVLADAAKSFNLQDLKADIILDEVYGICPMIKPPKSSKRYPSLPYWLGRKRQRNDLLAEELRLLYVAMTRARDTLLITASVSERQLDRVWGDAEQSAAREMANARCFMDWLGLWLGRVAGDKTNAGECALARWTIHDDSALAICDAGNAARSAGVSPADRQPDDPVAEPMPALPDFLSDPVKLREIEEKLSWKYRYAAAVQQPAKASVSTLRRAALVEVDDADSTAAFPFQAPAARLPAAKALDAGTVTHGFMQSVSLQCVGSEAQVRAEAERMVREGLLPEKDAALIDFEKVAAFWNSSLGKAALAEDAEVHRELPFTARFQVNEISELLGSPVSDLEANEFVVVQGVADLVLVAPDNLQIIDFKTDNVSGPALAERVKEYETQLRLYALALGRIYKRTVSGCWLYFLRAGEAVGVPHEIKQSAEPTR